MKIQSHVYTENMISNSLNLPSNSLNLLSNGLNLPTKANYLAMIKNFHQVHFL